MRCVVVDTNILIDYVNGYAPWFKNLVVSPLDFCITLPTIVIAEYFASKTFEEEKETIEIEQTFNLFTKQDLTENIAKILGRILRRKTYIATAGLGDLIIASTSIFLNAELATRNKKDFAKIPGLTFFDPKKYDLL